jgi:hypothetical protein
VEGGWVESCCQRGNKVGEELGTRSVSHTKYGHRIRSPLTRDVKSDGNRAFVALSPKFDKLCKAVVDGKFAVRLGTLLVELTALREDTATCASTVRAQDSPTIRYTPNVHRNTGRFLKNLISTIASCFLPRVQIYIPPTSGIIASLTITFYPV